MAFLYEKIKINGIEGVEIRGYEGSGKKVNVPETIDGLPVISVGKHAFTDKNKGLLEVSLPKTVVQIRDFSFYFCGDIYKINLTDHVDAYYDGAIRTSANICEVEMQMFENKYELVRRMLEDSDRKMRVKFCYPDKTLQLVFPAYNSNTIADFRAQTFHIRIEGSGFSYRECVRNDGIRLKEYDNLFNRARSGDESDISIEIAVARLMYPMELSDSAAEIYRQHLSEKLDRAMELAMLPENSGWMEMFMEEKLLNEAQLDHALQLASERKMIELTGMLMEYRRVNFTAEPKGKISLSALDDFDF